MPDVLEQAKRYCRNQIKVRGATVTGTISPMPTPNDTVVQFSNPPLWEGNNYFVPANPTRITVPRQRDGRYIIHAELQWEPVSPGKNYTLKQSQEGYFGAFLVINELTPTAARLAQSTAAVINNARLVSQNLMLETSLAVGDFVELYVSQRVSTTDPLALPFEIMVKAELTVRRLGRSA